MNTEDEKYGKKIEFKTQIVDPNKPRNVVDHLQWLPKDEDIINEISKNKNNFSLLLLNIDYDNNTGSIIRSANIFGAEEVLLYGRKKFDRRASVGAEFYSKFRQIKFVEEIEPIFKEFDLVVALENNIENKTIKLPDYHWDKSQKTLICLGQEGTGLPKEILDKVHLVLEIPQFGSVRSLNVATSAGIVMYDYCLKTKAFEKLA